MPLLRRLLIAAPGLPAQRSAIASPTRLSRTAPRSRLQAEAEMLAMVQLAAAYHQAARTEAVQRIGYRDTSLFLFLASSVTIFGVAVNDPSRIAVMYAVPVLGLGAAHVYAQHSRVIGTLSLYLAIDLEESVASIAGRGRTPVQWDNSESLLRDGGNNLPVLISAMSLVVLTQTAALLLVLLTRDLSWLDAIGVAIGVPTTALTAVTLTAVHRTRMATIREIRDHVATRR